MKHLPLPLLLFLLLLTACSGTPETTQQTAAEPTPAQAQPTQQPAPTAAPETTAPQQQAPTATAEAQPTAPPTDTPAAETSSALTENTDPLQAILGQHFAAAGAHTLRATMTNLNQATGEEFIMVTEFLPPDRMRTNNPAGDFIIVDGKTYMSQGGRSWIESPIDMSSLVRMLGNPDEAQALMAELEQDIGAVNSTPQLLRREELDGRQTLVYRYETRSDLSPEPVTSTIWLGVDDGRVYQLQNEMVLEGEPTLQTIIYEYDLPIDIQAPDLSAGPDLIDTCAVFTPDMAAAALDREVGQPEPGQASGGFSGTTATNCTYTVAGGFDFVMVAIEPFLTPEAAQEQLASLTEMFSGMPVEGVGDGAIWTDSLSSLYAVHDNFIIDITAFDLEPGREKAAELANAIIGNLP